MASSALPVNPSSSVLVRGIEEVAGKRGSPARSPLLPHCRLKVLGNCRELAAKDDDTHRRGERVMSTW